MNDSVVDFDLIVQVDPENVKVRKLSFYSELIWEARKSRAKTDGVTIDWVLLRNRLQHIEARNMRRVGERSEEHTSELQSLMRISYAVFCLKKKKQTNTTTNTDSNKNHHHDHGDHDEHHS